MRKLFLTLLLTATVATAHAGDMKSYTFDMKSWSEGAPPADVFVVNGTITVQTVQGAKVLQVGIDPLDAANAQIGTSANGSASMEAKVFASKMGRSLPRFGISLYGQNGFRLIAFPVKKELQITKGDDIIKTVPLDWTSDTWFRMKLEAKKSADNKWTVSGKIWPADGAEPKAPQITLQDDNADGKVKGQGKCSIWATPFSRTPIDFTDIKLELEQ